MLARQRIEYVIAVPNDPRWLSIDLSVQAIDGFNMDQMIAEFDQAVAGLTRATTDIWCARRLLVGPMQQFVDPLLHSCFTPSA